MAAVTVDVLVSGSLRLLTACHNAVVRSSLKTRRPASDWPADGVYCRTSAAGVMKVAAVVKSTTRLCTLASSRKGSEAMA